MWYEEDDYKMITTALILPLMAAAPSQFNVVSDKLEYRNLATVESATEFETFTGKTTKVSGSFMFDPDKKSGSGSFSVDLGSLDTGIPTRNEHLRSPMWLDSAKYPVAKFESTKVAYGSGDKYKVTGKFTLHGVTRTLTLPVQLKYRAESEETKKVGFAGSVAHVFTRFSVKLADYGIKIPDVAKGKVNPEVSITVSAYATTK